MTIIIMINKYDVINYVTFLLLSDWLRLGVAGTVARAKMTQTISQSNEICIAPPTYSGRRRLTIKR